MELVAGVLGQQHHADLIHVVVGVLNGDGAGGGNAVCWGAG
ncbi:MAG TPA: hypothetical protein VGC06_07205 [Actinomycetes bacterium]